MDNLAIKEIASQATAKDTNQLLLQHDAQIIHKDYQLSDLDQLLPEPRRFKGRLKTRCLNSFAEYANPTEESAFFIDEDNMQAMAILDFGTHKEPLHKDHTALFSPAATPDYEAIQQINGRTIPQREAAEFLEDWLHCIIFLKGDEQIPPKKGIAAIRKITIEQSRKEESEKQNLSESRSAMEKIEAKSDEGLPDKIVFNCKPYELLNYYDFEIRVSITTGQGIGIKLSIAKLDQMQLEMANEFKELVHEKLKSEADPEQSPRIFIGSFS